MSRWEQDYNLQVIYKFINMIIWIYRDPTSSYSSSTLLFNKYLPFIVLKFFYFTNNLDNAFSMNYTNFEWAGNVFMK